MALHVKGSRWVWKIMKLKAHGVNKFASMLVIFLRNFILCWTENANHYSQVYFAVQMQKRNVEPDVNIKRQVIVRSRLSQTSLPTFCKEVATITHSKIVVSTVKHWFHSVWHLHVSENSRHSPLVLSVFSLGPLWVLYCTSSVLSVYSLDSSHTPKDACEAKLRNIITIHAANVAARHS